MDKQVNIIQKVASVKVIQTLVFFLNDLYYLSMSSHAGDAHNITTHHNS